MEIANGSVTMELGTPHTDVALLAYAISCRDDDPEESEKIMTLLLETGAIKITP